MDTTVADPLLGALFDGRYRIRGRIAVGGMATVYHAVDERLDRVVAVKVIKPEYAGNAASRRTFDLEAKTIAQLTHPNVVAVYDTGVHSGLPYLVMEYVRGRTLRELLGQRRRLPVAEAAAVAESLLAALAAAHRAGLVHRDVKPENVLIGDDGGTVKVADFGLAHAVEASSQDPDGQLMATVAYVAPELVSEGRADARVDVYSAGIVLFEMLTGRVPYVGERSVDVAYQHVERDVPPPSTYVPGIPAALDDLVVRATRRDPARRPSDAAAFLGELAVARKRLHETTTARATARPVGQATVAIPRTEVEDYEPLPVRQLPHRRTGLVIAAMVVVLGMLAALGGWWLGAGRYTDTPSLLTMSKQQAQATASRLGFELAYDEGKYSEKVPKDVVLEQHPGPKDRIVKGSTITLTLSLGKERYQVPDVVGDELTDAKKKLEDRKLRVKLTERYSDSVPQNSVIAVSPKPGTVVKPNTPVTLVVSKGEAPIKVPDVVGDEVDDAEEELEELGLVVTIKREHSTEVERDHVIRQDPKAGTGVSDAATVTLVVSDGPPQVEVPDVTDKSLEEAKKVLEKAGFKVDVYDFPSSEDRVERQSPEGGEKADKGSTVTLVVT
ncbi:MAG: Stk1 family PASTA domain-containing Ser/Thr kinase [Micromonosporaceae bacterium]